MTKKEIRKQLASECKALKDSGRWREWNSRIIGSIRSNPHYARATRVLLYSALWDEVDLTPLYDDGKQYILPTVTGDDLELHEYQPGTDTRTGAFGITESMGKLVTDYGTIDLAIIPGRAFTTDGIRLGRGKGYYDRLLPQLACHTIGVCFPFQLLDELPAEPHDQRVDEVIGA